MYEEEGHVIIVFRANSYNEAARVARARLPCASQIGKIEP